MDETFEEEPNLTDYKENLVSHETLDDTRRSPSIKADWGMSDNENNEKEKKNKEETKKPIDLTGTLPSKTDGETKPTDKKPTETGKEGPPRGHKGEDKRSDKKDDRKEDRRDDRRGDRREERRRSRSRHSRSNRSRNRRNYDTRPPPRGGPREDRKRDRSRSVVTRPRTRRSRKNSEGRDELSLHEDSDEETTKEAEALAKEIRRETAGRQNFEDFPRHEYLPTAKLFVTSGYKTVNSIRTMEEQARSYFLTDLRKGDHKHRRTLKELRLVMALFSLFVIQKDEDKPKYEEITIPTKLRKWTPSLSNLKGFLLPDQDMCNHFSFELAKGRCEKPPMIPFVLAELRKKHWIPSQDAHIRALGRGRPSRNHTNDLRA